MQGKCSVLIGGGEECLMMGVSSVGPQSMQVFICVVCLMKKEKQQVLKHQRHSVEPPDPLAGFIVNVRAELWDGAGSTEQTPD